MLKPKTVKSRTLNTATPNRFKPLCVPYKFSYDGFFRGSLGFWEAARSTGATSAVAGGNHPGHAWIVRGFVKVSLIMVGLVCIGLLLKAGGLRRVGLP